MEKKNGECRITIVYDNYPNNPEMETDWGFACIIEAGGNTVLFDTGGRGDILLRNMRRIGIDPSEITAVVLSHAHGDHTGGIREVTKVPVYMGTSFPLSLRRIPASVIEVANTALLFDHIYTTGEMGVSIKAQSLVIDASDGLIVITGCAHPGIVNIIERSREMLPGREVYLVLGGFHLLSHSKSELKLICSRIRSLGVRYSSPSHCSGDECRTVFKEEYGDNYLRSGAGAVFHFSW